MLESGGTPRALAFTSPKASERDVCLAMLARVERHGHLTVVGDKGYAGREFEHTTTTLDLRLLAFLARLGRKSSAVQNYRNQQQVDVGGHRVLPRSTVRTSTADFDRTAPGPYLTTTTAVELLI